MPETVIKFNNQEWNFFLRDEADQSVMREIFKLREYKSAEEKIKEAKIIMDVGAHAGFFAIYCRALNATVKIFALEPEKNNVAAMKRHLEINKIKGVKIFPVALADQSGQRWLKVNTDSHNHCLSDSGDYQVSVYNLVDFCIENKIKKIDLLKMDIEGGEYEVVAGWEETSFALIGALIMEYHENQEHKKVVLEQKLRENKFAVQVFSSKFDKTMGFIFAVNKNHL